MPLAACGGDGKGGGTSAAAAVSQVDIDKAMSTATELTFWAWVPDIAQEVALFEQNYPAVKVKVVNAGQGGPEYTKLRTVLQAGTGAPDVAQIEFQYIPTFTITDSLLDLRPYGAAVWAIPQDTGPLGMLYRKDIFDQLLAGYGGSVIVWVCSYPRSGSARPIRAGSSRNCGDCSVHVTRWAPIVVAATC